MRWLRAIEARMLATPDQQISLTDPDARSMATGGRGSGIVGYNVQVAMIGQVEKPFIKLKLIGAILTRQK
jgi:hypothetical protein